MVMEAKGTCQQLLEAKINQSFLISAGVTVVHQWPDFTRRFQYARLWKGDVWEPLC